MDPRSLQVALGQIPLFLGFGELFIFGKQDVALHVMLSLLSLFHALQEARSQQDI